MNIEQTNILEIEINPRTGLPYKQSAKLREQKRQWALRNPEKVLNNSLKWADNNRARLYKIQCAYHKRKREEHKYLLELFNEGLGEVEILV